MKFPGKLEAGLQSGVLTESKYIKGTYIVFSTETEKNDFTKCGCKEVLVKGTKCYVASEKQEYRWDGSKWVPLQTDIPVAPADGKIYGIQNGQWVEVNVAGLDATIEEINNNLNGIENSINGLQEKIEYDTNMVNYLNQEFVNKADKSDIPTQTSQLENDSGFITLTVAEDKFATIESFDNLNTVVEGTTNKINQLNDELTNIQNSIADLDSTVVKYTTFTSPETITITSINGKIGNSVDIDDPTTPSLPTSDSETQVVQTTRKTIRLDNYDSISGYGTDELADEAFNLAMVSKWNVADFGSSKIHLNLNTKDNVTINDNLVVLTTEDKTELQNEIQQAVANAEHIHFEVVEELPTEDIDTNAIYLIANGDFYNEYIYVDGKWDSIGSTGEVNLNNYYNKNQTETLIDNAVGNAYQDIQNTLTLYPKAEDVTDEIQEAIKDLASDSDIAQLGNSLNQLNNNITDLETDVNSLSKDLESRYSNNYIDELIQTVDNKLGNYVTITTYTQAIENLDNTINTKQDRLISEGENQNIKTINGQSILGNGNIEITGGGDSSYILPVATKTTLGGIKSGTYESAEGTVANVVVDGEGNATVKIPPLSTSTNQQDIVNILNSGTNKVLISGGSANE